MNRFKDALRKAETLRGLAPMSKPEEDKPKGVKEGPVFYKTKTITIAGKERKVKQYGEGLISWEGRGL